MSSPYFSSDDIAQIGTPPGPAPVGAIRISGPNAFAILARATRGLENILADRPKRSVHACRVVVELSRRRDGGPERAACECPGRAFLMPAPASYTREDVAEIHLPGAPVLLQAALATLVRAGARPAAPGEFTFRAFRNGRLSLGQAEAVEEVIRAANAADLRRALGRLGERARERVESWRSRAMDLVARVEAALDFSEEELDADVAQNLADMVAALEREGADISGTMSPASTLPTVALVGRTNAGKSSLFNALLADDTALVSTVPSTTRDSLHREVNWAGTRFLLSDNPGFHPGGTGAAGDAANAAARRLGGSDMACWVVDGSVAPDDRDREFAAGLSGGVVVAINKCDLPLRVKAEYVVALAADSGLAPHSVVLVSAATGAGVDGLRQTLADVAKTLVGSGQWNRREIFELTRALAGCRAAAGELAGVGRLELAAEDLREAAMAFSRALGDGYAEETLTRIFSSFCIGK